MVVSWTIFHVIEYQYRGLPHAHIVIRLKDAYDIIEPNREDLMIHFVNKYFVAEMPRFEGEEHQNVNTKDGDPEFTEEYKRKAIEVVFQ